MVSCLQRNSFSSFSISSALSDLLKYYKKQNDVINIINDVYLVDKVHLLHGNQVGL